MDVRGILGIDSDVRNGFSGIKVTYNIDADASPDDIKALVAQSQKRSAVYDIITNPTIRQGRGRLSATRSTAAVVIGAGHAGLAMSRCLATRGIDHVVLERGTAANTWKTERWDSLTLLTPNWQSRLPDYRYEGDDPDGYMTMPEVISFIEGYAAADQRADAHANTTVTSVKRDDDGFVVETDQGTWRSPTVVLASGHCNVAAHPAGSPSSCRRASR